LQRENLTIFSLLKLKRTFVYTVINHFFNKWWYTFVTLPNSLPEKVSIDEMMEKLLFIYEVEVGMEQSKANQVTPHNDVKEKHKKWLK
jgi:hypothetical protein